MTSLTQATIAKDTSVNLFASPTRQVTPSAKKLATGLTGSYAIGFPLKQGADADTVTPVTAAADQVVAVLGEAVADASTATIVCVYEEGNFNKYTVQAALTARSVAVTTADMAVKARMKGIDFSDVIKGGE